MKDYRCLSRRHRIRPNCQKYLRIPLDILLIRSLSSYDRLRTNSEASLSPPLSPPTKLSGDTNIVGMHAWKTETKTLEYRYKLAQDTKLPIENEHIYVPIIFI